MNENNNSGSISYWQAMLYWLKLGFVSFGGPAGQISMMHQELVEKRRWISEHRFLHALNYTMVLPGPEAQQLATYIGWLMHGIPGGLTAGLLFVLPSLVILIALTWTYLEFGHVAVISGILYGIKPAVTAIVLFAAYRIGSRALKNNLLRLIALISFIAIFLIKIPFPVIILGAGLVGFIGARYWPEKFIAGNHAVTPEKTWGPAIIDDNTPVPLHAKFTWLRIIKILLTGILLWLCMMYLLFYIYGWEGTFVQMSWFFTKAAFLTFGGAYAVLPYVYQGGVEHYAWLTGSQMIDGLALGETTPGPLIMIVAFVGFVGGWTNAVFGSSLALAGIVGAAVATYFTFLPSFLFILIGGPFVEATRHEIHFTAPLTSITAAVVGVVINLAVFFAYHVLWPSGFTGNFDWLSALLGILAIIALFRFRIGIVRLIGGFAVIGILFSFTL